MDYAVRPAATADALMLADLHVSTWKEAYSHLLPETFFTEDYVEGRRRMWDDILTRPRSEWTIRVGEVDGSIAGFSWAGPGIGEESGPAPRDLQLYAIYVKASAYGSGIGQALFDSVLGSEPAMLWVAKENPRAIAFYRRNGFTFDGLEKKDPSAPAITDARMIR